MQLNTKVMAFVKVGSPSGKSSNIAKLLIVDPLIGQVENQEIVRGIVSDSIE